RARTDRQLPRLPRRDRAAPRRQLGVAVVRGARAGRGRPDDGRLVLPAVLGPCVARQRGEPARGRGRPGVARGPPRRQARPPLLLSHQPVVTATGRLTTIPAAFAPGSLANTWPNRRTPSSCGLLGSATVPS